MGRQVLSPPTIDVAHLEHHRYTEAELVQPCLSLHDSYLSATRSHDLSDQPMYWSNYAWQPYQPCYATMPATAAVPIPITAGPSSVAQHSVYPPPQPQAQTVPPSGTQTSLPTGAYEMNGTMYFPASMPSVPAPPPVTYSIPVHPVPYHHTMAPAYPYYAPPTLPAGYYDIPNQMTGLCPQTSFDPFASDPMMPSELPVIPRLEDYPMSPIEHDALALSSPFAPSGDLGSTTTTGQPTVTQEHEFPYRAPKNQRVGHARRISVNIKKSGRANSG